MESIVDSILNSSGRIMEDYRSLLGDIAQQATVLRKVLLDEGQIVKLPVHSANDIENFSLCSIDGASASEKLQSGDLMIAGSSLHDGAQSKPVYDNDEDIPSFSFADIRLHSSKNDKVLSAMRAYTEIAVLGAANDHNMVIIDGAYLGNFSTVIFALQESKETAQRLIEALGEPSGKFFVDGVRKLLNLTLKTKGSQEIVALAKSDSSSEIVKELLPAGSELITSDKILAGYLLMPGEILRPRFINKTAVKPDYVSEHASNPDYGWEGFKWPVKAVLSPIEYQRLEVLFALTEDIEKARKKDNDSSIFSQLTYLIRENNLHYSYFKPNNFDQGSHALRLEFTTVRAANTVDEHLVRATQQAGYLAGYIDSDVISPAIKEPYSQYMVDQIVKKPVSSSMKLLKSILANGLAEHGDPMHALSSYRS